jgi:ornithine carbamoyltransferase
MMRHFLDIDELSKDELEHVLDLSSQPTTTAPLAGKGMALLFEKPSARTRNAMEMAVVQLGGHPVYIRPDELGLDVRESVEDVARTFACYHDLLGARVFAHATVERMAALDAIPVVNLLSDKSHPMQALGDLLTMRSELSVLEDRTITFIGDANNVALSLAKAAGLAGMRFRLAGPSSYSFSHEDITEISASGADVEIFRSPYEAVADADVVYTDTWASMGKENVACIFEFKGESYFAYHNGALPGGGSHRRSVCIDRLYYNSDGTMRRVMMTSEGISPWIEKLAPYSAAKDAC